ncbi:MAG: CBS domain-containing protein [Deltaproteobacteria bacterium]|nr:CBS domain-containing protein [Deltaproteobacteria bacterium]MBW2593126.1 CBS domain-containing protein [Deltaproteobacteria bacterium]
MKYFAKDLMVPIAEYATVSKGATLLESLLALEKAQEEFTQTGYSHRAVLIMDKNKRVVGKLSQLDFLRVLEHADERIYRDSDICKFGFSPMAIVRHREKKRGKGASMEEILSTAANFKVEDFMQSPSEGEYIEEDTPLDTAAHQLTTGLHLSLLVTKENEIVGVLRMADVFAAVFHTMKESELRQ